MEMSNAVKVTPYPFIALTAPLRSRRQVGLAHKLQILAFLSFAHEIIVALLEYQILLGLSQLLGCEHEHLSVIHVPLQSTHSEEQPQYSIFKHLGEHDKKQLDIPYNRF